MKKIIIFLIILFGLFGLKVALTNAQGAGYEIGRQLQATAGQQGAALGDPIDPRVTAVFIIRVLLSFTSIVMIGLIVYAGFTWMTAGGNEEKVEGAKTTIRNSVIGLVIVLSAYSITLFAANLARGTAAGNVNPLSGIFGTFFQQGK